MTSGRCRPSYLDNLSSSGATCSFHRRQLALIRIVFHHLRMSYVLMLGRYLNAFYTRSQEDPTEPHWNLIAWESMSLENG